MSATEEELEAVGLFLLQLPEGAHLQRQSRVVIANLNTTKNLLLLS